MAKHLADVEVLIWDKAPFPATCIPAVQKMEKENISVCVCMCRYMLFLLKANINFDDLNIDIAV